MLRGRMDDTVHLSMKKGGAQLEISTCTQGDHDPLHLMSKGESDLVFLLPSSPKGEIVGITMHVLYLMATHL